MCIFASLDKEEHPIRWVLLRNQLITKIHNCKKNYGPRLRRIGRTFFRWRSLSFLSDTCYSSLAIGVKFDILVRKR
ncbi:MAG: hypothetical protein AMJ75_02805 [Phycisphaerae bacterium SM1_79]|nr:MAG: hypothetical protein AMJ75_02805 [Phycisphaerae bacterium SM1_79]